MCLCNIRTCSWEKNTSVYIKSRMPFPNYLLLSSVLVCCQKKLKRIVLVLYSCACGRPDYSPRTYPIRHDTGDPGDGRTPATGHVSGRTVHDQSSGGGRGCRQPPGQVRHCVGYSQSTGQVRHCVGIS